MCRELRLCKYVENCTVECATSSNFPYGMKGVGVLKKNAGLQLTSNHISRISAASACTSAHFSRR